MANEISNKTLYLGGYTPGSKEVGSAFTDFLIHQGIIEIYDAQSEWKHEGKKVIHKYQKARFLKPRFEEMVNAMHEIVIESAHGGVMDVDAYFQQLPGYEPDPLPEGTEVVEKDGMRFAKYPAGWLPPEPTPEEEEEHDRKREAMLNTLKGIYEDLILFMLGDDAKGASPSNWMGQAVEAILDNEEKLH